MSEDLASENRALRHKVAGLERRVAELQGEPAGDERLSFLLRDRFDLSRSESRIVLVLWRETLPVPTPMLCRRLTFCDTHVRVTIGSIRGKIGAVNLPSSRQYGYGLSEAFRDQMASLMERAA